jgi:hypothetical protein
VARPTEQEWVLSVEALLGLVAELVPGRSADYLVEANVFTKAGDDEHLHALRMAIEFLDASETDGSGDDDAL